MLFTPPGGSISSVKTLNHRAALGDASPFLSRLNYAIWPVIQSSASAPHWPNSVWLTHPSSSPPLRLTYLFTCCQFLPHSIDIQEQESFTVHVYTHHTQTHRGSWSHRDCVCCSRAAACLSELSPDWVPRVSHPTFSHLPDSSPFCTHAATRLTQHSRLHSEQWGMMSYCYKDIAFLGRYVLSEDARSQNAAGAPLKIALFNS